MINKDLLLIFIIFFLSSLNLYAEESVVGYQKLGISFSLISDASIEINDKNETINVKNADGNFAETSYGEFGYDDADDLYVTDVDDGFVTTLDYNIGQQYVSTVDNLTFDTFGMSIGGKAKFFYTPIYKGVGFVPYIDLSYWWVGMSIGPYIPVYTYDAKKVDYLDNSNGLEKPVLKSTDLDGIGMFFSMRLADRLKGFNLDNIQIIMDLGFSEIDLKNTNQSLFLTEFSFGVSYYFGSFSGIHGRNI